MTPERWNRLKRLVSEAAELAPELQDDFLEAHARGDHQLMRSARGLLDRETQCSDFLEHPVPLDPLRYAPELGGLPGEVGRFRLLWMRGSSLPAPRRRNFRR